MKDCFCVYSEKDFYKIMALFYKRGWKLEKLTLTTAVFSSDEDEISVLLNYGRITK